MTRTIKWNVIMEESHCFHRIPGFVKYVAESARPPHADDILGKYHFDFRRNRSTINRIFALGPTLEKEREFKKPVQQLLNYQRHIIPFSKITVPVLLFACEARSLTFYNEMIPYELVQESDGMEWISRKN